MKKYEKPVLLTGMDYAEGIYLASGDVAVEEGIGQAKCDSIYMQGVWQNPDYSQWDETGRGYKAQFGCLGCPANTANGCGLLTHYEDSGYAQSYSVDDGKRKPSWETKGYGPDELVTDWNM